MWNPFYRLHKFNISISGSVDKICVKTILSCCTTVIKNSDDRVEKLITLNDGTRVGLYLWYPFLEYGIRTTRLDNASTFFSDQAVILLFDCTDKVSFNHLSSWLKQIHKYDNHTPVAILGCKSDKARQVSTEQAQSFAKSNDIAYWEVSESNNENANKALKYLAEIAFVKKSFRYIIDPKKQFTGYLDIKSGSMLKKYDDAEATIDRNAISLRYIMKNNQTELIPLHTVISISKAKRYSLLTTTNLSYKMKFNGPESQKYFFWTIQRGIAFHTWPKRKVIIKSRKLQAMNLGENILRLILSYVDAMTLLNCGMVCTCWNEMSNVRTLWERFLYPQDDKSVDPKLVFILKTIHYYF